VSVRDADAVIDLVGADTQERSFQVLRRGGKPVSTVSQPDKPFAQSRGIEATFFLVEVTSKYLKEITALVDTGMLRIHPTLVRLAECWTDSALSPRENSCYM